MSNMNYYSLYPNFTLYNGKYRIVKILGEGGFAITYLSLDTRNRQYVAIKEFFPRGNCSRDNCTGVVSLNDEMAKYKRKFLSEAKKLSQLSHQGIVKVLEAFEENGTAYFAMEYIDGKSLLEILKSQRCSVEKAVLVISHVADAVGYVHSKSMLHLDIKPGNIVMRSSDGMPVLIDFGISKTYNLQGEANTTYMPAASFGYSSLEQLRGEISKFFPQLDIYSLGATLYTLVTGKLPPYPSPKTASSLTFQSDIPIRMRKIIVKAMAYRMSDRYSSISEFLNDIIDPLSAAHQKKPQSKKTEVFQHKIRVSKFENPETRLIFLIVSKVLAESLGKDVQTIRYNDDLRRDYELDSLLEMSLVFKFEKVLNTTLKNWENINTVSDIVDYIVSLKYSKSWLQKIWRNLQ